MPRRLNFDRIAGAYRWLEYFTLGRTLERCRFHFLPQVADRTRALAFGDGDGRFLAALMVRNPSLTVDAVDISAAMLDRLRKRCNAKASKSESRLHTHRTDALSYLAGGAGDEYDLVVTHFFLDCLTQLEMNALATEVAPRLARDALWVVSDFRIPEGPMTFPARALVSGLYFAFRMLTGLRTNRLPNHAAAMKKGGFRRSHVAYFLFGIVMTEVWTRVDQGSL